MEIIPRPSLGMGERNSEAATRDPGDYLSALLGTAAVAQETAAEHDGSEIRFERQGSAERFHRNHRLDRPAGGAAVTLGEGQPQQPELGVLRPQLAAPAFRVLAVGLALLERVTIAGQPIEAFLQQPLFFAEIEIHRSLLPAGSCPSPSRCAGPSLSPLKRGEGHPANFSLAPLAGRGSG